MNKKILLLLLSVFILTTNLTAQPKKKGIVPPIFGISAGTLPKGGFVYRSYVVLPQFNKMYDAKTNSMINMPQNTELKAVVFPQMIRYGIFNNLTFIANLNYLTKKLTKPTIQKKASGFGDLQLALKTNVYKKPGTIISLVGVMMLPTGKYKNLKKDELPLGKGETSYSFVGIVNQKIGKTSNRFLLSYNFKQKKSDGIRPGPQIKGIYTGVMPISENWYFETDLLAEYNFKDKKNGNAIPHSEQYLYQLAPGIQYHFKQWKGLYLQSAMAITLNNKMMFGKNVEYWFGIFYKLNLF